MKYFLDTKKKCLMMDLSGKSGSNNEDLNDEWSMKAFCDSDYAGDKDTRISVTGFIIYITSHINTQITSYDITL